MTGLLFAGLALALVGALEVMAGRVGHQSGFASSGHLRRALGARQLRRRAAVLRPDAQHTRELGIELGRAGRATLHGSIEDSYLILGPPRSGKGAGFLIPALRTWDGPAIVTSTRDDLVRATAMHRADRGPVMLFDPAGLIPVADGDAFTRVGWNPVAGCEKPLTAILRARALVTASRSGEGVTNGDFWKGSAQTILRCLLHAAAIDGQDMRVVRGWVSQQTSPEPLSILRREGAAEGWVGELAAITHMDERTRTNVFAGVGVALASLADPSVMAATCGGSVINPDALFDDGATLFLVGPADAQHSVAPLVVALVEAVVDGARRRAAQSESGRLNPPLGLFLDEAAQIAPLPSLPKLVADGGGTGITTVTVLQSLAQARERWGGAGADVIWDSSTVRLVLGGINNHDDLRRISQLCGETDVRVSAKGANGPSVSHRTRSVMAPDQIRSLRPWDALLLFKGLRPAVVRLRPHWKNHG